MPVRILTIPFNPEKKMFLDEELSKFLINKRVKTLIPQFFQTDGQVFWSVFVEYEVILEEDGKSDSDGLNEAQRLLLKRLREWRKEKAEKEGIPVFIIATNKQFVDLIKRSPVSMEAVKEIHGFGKKKVDRYGKELVEIVKAFYEKRPLHQGARIQESEFRSQVERWE
jgi:superfamily II DNA helicase RecQ